MKPAAPYSRTLSKHQSTKTPTRQPMLKSSAASATPFRPLSTPNRRSTAKPTDLPTKIAQLKTTIEHTQEQLVELLDKLAALPFPEKRPDSTTALRSAITQFTQISTTPDLTPTQQATLSGAQGVLDRHIKLLGQYNQLKDAGMMMLGLIAEREGRVVKDIMAERGVEDDD